MFCWNCGKEMDDDLRFCPGCGMKQAGVPEPPKSKTKVTGLAVCCGLCAAALVLGLLFLILKPAGDTPPVPEGPETTQPIQTTNPGPAPDPDSAELPDIAAFLGTEYTEDGWGITHHVACILRGSQADQAAREVLELLQLRRYQLELTQTREYAEDGADSTDYLFRYTGTNEMIDWVHHRDGYKYHVKLTVRDHGSRDQVTLVLYSYPEFYLEDPGSRSSYEELPEESTSGETPAIGKRNCITCGYDGSCNRCSGGYYYVIDPETSQRVRKECTSPTCSGGVCTRCGGDGIR